jgi:predicted kinase
MTTLTIMRGVSGSGKSTRARQIADATNAQIVSRDDIRLGIFNTEFDPAIEDRVSVFEKSAIEGFLRAGIDVISDNTNIEWKYVKATAKIGHRQGADVRVEVVDAPLHVCLARNSLRALVGGRDVPESIIRKQHDRFQGTRNNVLDPVAELIPYDGTPGKEAAIMVDIDGTLAKMINRGPYDWLRVEEDEAMGRIVELVNVLSDEFRIIVMSGRDAVCRQQTINWLDKHIFFDNLFMRPEKDMRADNIVKAELFNDHVRDNYDVKFVLDDRQQVVDMWRAMGLTCLQVAPGDF